MGPSGYSESEYAFLDRSGRPEFERVRSLMNQWFTEFPRCSRADLKGRIRSDDSRQHFGALSELFLHALFSRLEYEINVVPAGSDNESRPDFYLKSETLSDFDLEVTTAMIPGQDEAKEKRINELHDYLNQIDSPDFFLRIEIRESPTQHTKIRRIRNQLQNLLRILDYDELHNAWISNNAVPRYSLEADGWQLVVQMIPKSPDARGKLGVRPIGSLAERGRSFRSTISDDTASLIRRALKDKMTKYGPRTRPYIVAVVDKEPFSDVREYTRALLGSEVSDQDLERDSDGLFFGPDGPKNTRVSGVVCVRGFGIGVVGRITPLYIENPWSKHGTVKMPEVFERWHVDRVNGTLTRNEATIAVYDQFGLYENWPYQNIQPDSSVWNFLGPMYEPQQIRIGHSLRSVTC